jgi:glycine cleavage system H protein
MNIPAELKYTKDHEWAKVTGSEITVGITAFAVEQLGDITLVNFDVKEGDTLESVKTLSDLYAPIAGKVLKINATLASAPEAVNEDCYGKAWMVTLAVDPKDLASLLEPDAYKAHVQAAG